MYLLPNILQKRKRKKKEWNIYNLSQKLYISFIIIKYLFFFFLSFFFYKKKKVILYVLYNKIYIYY